MIAKKKTFFTGLGMMVIFIVVLGLMFAPLINGTNVLEFCDSLYNSISKGSAYYIPAAKEKSAVFNGTMINVTLNFEDEKTAKKSAKLFSAAGAKVDVVGGKHTVEGDLGQILTACIQDSDFMYANDEKQLSGRYEMPGKLALYTWWKALKILDKELSKQKKFKEAKVVTLVKKKAVETAYNYFGIEGQKIMERLGLVIASLIFYVVYTVWYGFAIMYLFEGWGLRLEH